MENGATGANQPDLTGQVLFYKRPEPLSLERHRGLGVKQIPAPFSFLKSAHAVPITVSEFGLVATCFPIIFVGQEKTPVAVMGIRQNENEYVDDAGNPDPDVYLPAFARRYPFVFASDPQSDRLLLCIDRDAPMISDQPDMPLFDGDEPSKFTQDAIEFCKEFERQRRATVEFVELLDKSGLLESKTVSFTPRDAQGNPQRAAEDRRLLRGLRRGPEQHAGRPVRGHPGHGRPSGCLCPPGVADELAAGDPAHDAAPVGATAVLDKRASGLAVGVRPAHVSRSGEGGGPRWTCPDIRQSLPAGRNSA